MKPRQWITTVLLLVGCGSFALGFGMFRHGAGDHTKGSDAAWETQIKALRLSEAGRYAEAEPIFRQAMQMEEAKSTQTWTYDLCLLRFVRNSVAQEHYAQALPELNKLYIRYFMNEGQHATGTLDRIFIADCLNDTGLILMLDKDYKTARLPVSNALQMREHLQDTDTLEDRQDRFIDTAATLDAFGHWCIAEKNYIEGENYLNRAARLMASCSQRTNWPYCDIQATRLKVSKLLLHTVPSLPTQDVFDFYPPRCFNEAENGKWPIYLQAAERITRKSTDCWWHTSDAPMFYEKALREAERFGPNDPRLAGTLLQFGRYEYLQSDKEKALPMFLRALKICSSNGRKPLDLCREFIAHVVPDSDERTRQTLNLTPEAHHK